MVDKGVSIGSAPHASDIGAPQFGQADAFVDTSFLHSGQFIKAI